MDVGIGRGGEDFQETYLKHLEEADSAELGKVRRHTGTQG